uniref:TEN1 subunit of CST complex n=1 Tax=Pundamilia nyererei TaxID=303518 RepID=A0A3B4GLK0_9CICH
MVLVSPPHVKDSNYISKRGHMGSWDCCKGNSTNRLVCYQPEESRATLSAQHASKEHRVVVHTLFVEPFNPIIGAQYTVLGEIENDEIGAMVRARVLNCVDGVNIALLEKAITEQRNFFTERERKLGAQPADAT